MRVKTCPPANCRAMKRIDFSIVGDDGHVLHEPGFVEDCSELPLAIMRSVEDFMEAHDGKLSLPITIRVQPTFASPTC